MPSSFLLLFTFALSSRIYVDIQETICRKHLSRWLATTEKKPGSIPIMMIARHLNMETSLGVFCGPYIPEEAANEINTKYWDITLSLELVNFPLALPGTKVYKAIQARKVAMYWLEQAAHKSKIAMAEGGEPACMLDEWSLLSRTPTTKDAAISAILRWPWSSSHSFSLRKML